MNDRVVLLSGEHPTLPLAELQGLLAVHEPRARILSLHPACLRISSADPHAVDAALARMALARSWSEYWTHTGGGEEGLALVHEHVRDTADGKGTIAVRAHRSGPRGGLSGAGIEQTLGTVLHMAGHDVDLDQPDDRVTAWLYGDAVVVGRHIADIDRARYEHRQVEARAHFSPVTMHPRRAASLVHLARVAPGGRILDPFCGTGGIVLEAALDGYDAWGSDIDAWMVQGTYQTLTDAADEALDGQVFVADIGDVPELVESVDAIVTDMPYGQGSTTRGEELAVLYDRAFAAFADVLEPGARVVLGCPAADLAARITHHGFTVEEQHEDYVHRSLTRHFIVARRL